MRDLCASATAKDCELGLCTLKSLCRSVTCESGETHGHGCPHDHKLIKREL